MLLAVLVPGLELEEQPHLPNAMTSRLAVEADLQRAMNEAMAAVREVLDQQQVVVVDNSKAPSSYSQPSSESRYGVGEPWATLAECESGNWINGGESFERGSARWAWGGADPIPPWGTAIHHGGLQHHPDTWDWVAPMVGLGHIARAYHATPQEQVQVAEKVLELQGPQAWPVCSVKIGGLR